MVLHSRAIARGWFTGSHPPIIFSEKFEAQEAQGDAAVVLEKIWMNPPPRSGSRGKLMSVQEELAVIIGL